MTPATKLAKAITTSATTAKAKITLTAITVATAAR